jgi:septal ring factor EnvC (AmiA/AmiB activator)
MNAPEDLNRLYADVSDSIGSAMADILALNVEHKEGKREIGNITDKLRDIQTRFDSELHQLKTHAEWDTFTLAFFGETNAGKSTIIESLRILFKEESRQALLQQHADDLEQFTQALTVHLERVREGLHALYSEYTGELAAISQGTARLAQIAQHEAQERSRIAQAEADARAQLAQQETQARLEAQQQEAARRQQLAEAEAAARNKLAEQEASARLAAEQQEAAQRLQIEQAHAASRFKVRLALFGVGGILIGATAAVALLKLAGA